MAVFETTTGVQYDGLFAGPEKEVFTKNVTASADIQKGQLVTITGSTATPTLKAGETGAEAAGAIAAEAIAADAVGTVFTSGYFNREKLIVNEGDTVTAHEEELRSVGIYLSSLK